MTSTHTKKVYFEFMRIVAIALVIFNHLPGYTLYQISSGPKQLIYMILTMITRINVPLFFMISGALLLRKHEDYPTIFKKRLPRYLLLLLVFEGALFCCFKINAVLQREEVNFTLRRFVLGLFAGNLEGTRSYWYLYSYLGMLLTLPFMQRIARNLRKEDFWLLMGLHFIISSLIPMLNILLKIANIDSFSLSDSFSTPFATTKQFFYPILGYYLENYIDVKKIKRKQIFGMVMAALVGIYLSCLCTYWEGLTTGGYSQNYVQLFDYLTTVVAFIVIKYMMVQKFPQLVEGAIAKCICFIGSLTLGIYLLDPFFKLFFYSEYNDIAEPLLPTLIVSAGWVLISMILGGTTTFILKKIPGIKKLL